jgi:uncharacterized Zn finger protein
MYNSNNLDLSREATEEYFEERDLATAVKNMESVEHWTRDRYEEVQEMLQRLADVIEQADLSEISESLQHRLIYLLGYISSGKAIRLLMWMESEHPAFVAKTLTEAHLLSFTDIANDPSAKLSAKLFVERFYVLERLNVLSRVFERRRLELVTRVLGILNGKDPE